MVNIACTRVCVYMSIYLFELRVCVYVARVHNTSSFFFLFLADDVGGCLVVLSTGRVE